MLWAHVVKNIVKKLTAPCAIAKEPLLIIAIYSIINGYLPGLIYSSIDTLLGVAIASNSPLRDWL